MAIKDLEARQGNVDVVVEIVEIGEVKEFQKFGKTGRVATAKAKDESGEINLSLWNEQIEQVKPGDKVHITNGYVNEFQGEKQLTTGKFGKLEVVGQAEAGAAESGTAEAVPEDPANEPMKVEEPKDPEEEPLQVEPEVQEETVTEEKVE